MPRTLTRYDTALRVFETYKAAAPQEDAGKTFVYVSAEDVFRPFVPKRYIDSKRQAEEEISRLCGEISPSAPIRDVFIRPGWSLALPTLRTDAHCPYTRSYVSPTSQAFDDTPCGPPRHLLSIASQAASGPLRHPPILHFAFHCFTSARWF